MVVAKSNVDDVFKALTTVWLVDQLGIHNTLLEFHAGRRIVAPSIVVAINPFPGPSFIEQCLNLLDVELRYETVSRNLRHGLFVGDRPCSLNDDRLGDGCNVGWPRMNDVGKSFDFGSIKNTERAFDAGADEKHLYIG
jgi:hypothetical protein